MLSYTEQKGECMGEGHKILERAITPDGVSIQIEDWTEVYPGTYKTYNIGCYPIAKQSGRNGWIKKGDKFRCNLEHFDDNEKVKEIFEKLKNGDKTIDDYEEHIIEPKYRYYYGLIEEEPWC